MAVAFGTVVNATPATGTSLTSPSITTPASNPVVMVYVGLAHATAVVNSLTITGFGGTVSEVKNVRATTGGSIAYFSIWKIVAPTPSTAGTVQANISASCPIQLAVDTFSGADQTDPSPVADAVTNVAAVASAVLTPTNLVAGDATAGGNTNTLGQDVSAVIPNSRFVGNSTPINLAVGDATNTTGITVGVNFTGASAKIAVRLKQAAAAPPPATPAAPAGLLGTLRAQAWT